MLVVGMLFGLLVLAPLVMLLVFALARNERIMAAVRRPMRSRRPTPPASGGTEEA